MPKSTVVRLVPSAVSRDTVEACEFLLQEARAGRLIGLSWVAHLPAYHFNVDLAGEARRHPAFTQGAILTLLDEVGKLPKNGRP